MSDNLKIYNAVCTVPKEALKEIRGGRMNGKSDINPMWRIKALTEQFGPCGIGWKYEVVRFWLESGANGEIAAFAQINLYIKDGDNWSEGIPGIGGSSFVAKEKSGLYVSDECYKMALTDAISVSCKALGVAANVYWEKDPTKYDKPNALPPNQPSNPPQNAAQPQHQKHTRAEIVTLINELLFTKYADKAPEMCMPITGYKDASDIPTDQLGAALKKVKAAQ